MYKVDGKEIIFVYGSNRAGIHGAGAALFAKKHYGAVQGRGIGLHNKCYGIPTKGWHMEVLTLPEIQSGVNDFLQFADACMVLPDRLFWITAIGTGLAGYSHKDIAPLFKAIPPNCRLPSQWEAILRNLGAGLDPKCFTRRSAV